MLRRAVVSASVGWFLLGLAAAVVLVSTAETQQALRADRKPSRAAALASGGKVGGATGQAPQADVAIASVEPILVGVGTKIRIRGRGLGTQDDAVVQFVGGQITTWIEKHTPEEIVVRVPIGAQDGPVRVYTGVPTADRLVQMAPVGQQAALAAARTTAATQESLMIIAPFVKPARADQVATTGGLKLLKNRLVVDLADFYGFEDAVRIANQVAGELAGFIAPSNSYVIDLEPPPADLKGLYAIADQVRLDARVADVWHDLLLELGQAEPPRFADSDVVHRYSINDPPGGDPYGAYAVRRSQLHGRMDVWAYDRIQAPAAWNLVKRFADPPGAIKVAVLDTGCDEKHAEFKGVDLKEVEPVLGWVQLRIAATTVELPPAGSLVEKAYTSGDNCDPNDPNDFCHGTAVVSIIGALNGNDLGGGDRGMNGLLSPNGGPYTIQIYRGSAVSETGDVYTVTEFLVAINSGAITGARVMNASWGQPRPIDPVDPDPNDPNDPQDHVRASLRKLARQLNQFQDDLLLCVAAGNEAQDPNSYNAGEVTPFEDFNLNYRLDPGEDINGNGRLDHGNYVAASLGTLPNVLTVGAIGGPHLDPNDPGNWARDDKRAEFSNYGSHDPYDPNEPNDPGGEDLVVQIAAPGVDVFTAQSTGPIVIGGQHFGRDEVAGTSFSTPLTTGAAALLMAVDDKIRGAAPRLKPAEIKQLLLATTFPVDTTDGLGRAMRWNTLKAGAAVRKLLVDRGTIADAEPWSGISKIVRVAGRVEGVELRQNPTTRRPEPFRVYLPDFWADPKPRLTMLSADGKRIGWWAEATWESKMLEKDIEKDTEREWPGPPPGDSMSRVIDYHYVDSLSPDPLEPLALWYLTYSPDCPTGNYESIWGEAEYTKILPPPFDSYLIRHGAIAPRPDLRKVYLGFRLTHKSWDPTCTFFFTHEDIGTFLLDYPDAGGDIPIPPPHVIPYYSQPEFSPDGRLFSGNNLDTSFAEVRRDRPDGEVLWNGWGIWSPDGSEVYGDIGHLRDGSGEDNWCACEVRSWSW